MEIKFCGAAGTVTGSSHLLTLDDGFRILLDCGLYQGNEEKYENFNRHFLYTPADIDVVILSHAHIDHSGKLPKLVKDGFQGSIYATPATRDLTSILLLDSAHIQDRESDFTNKRMKEEHDREEPLYVVEDVVKTMDQFRLITYNHWFSVHPDVDVIFKDSGHILGSASVTLRIRRQGLKDTYFGFTADIGRPDRPILRDPDPMPPCDYLICESTYGDRLHEEGPAEKEHLLRIIRETCLDKKGKVIIPAFSVGRTQEIVYMLDQLHGEGLLPDIPVYVDSPLSVSATAIFQQHPDCFDKEILRYMLNDPNPFGFESLKYIRSVDESRSLNDKKGCIIISASGMMNAGRIRHHLFNTLEHAENTILIVGFASAGTTGGALRRGAEEIRIFGKTLKVKARVEMMDSFSAHGDWKEMIHYLRTQQKDKLRKLFLVHGDEGALDSFRGKLLAEGYMDVEIVRLGETVRL